MEGLDFFESLKLENMVKAEGELNKIKTSDVISSVVGLDKTHGVFSAKQVYNSNNNEFYLTLDYEREVDGNTIDEHDVYLLDKDNLNDVAIVFAEAILFSDKLREFLVGGE